MRFLRPLRLLPFAVLLAPTAAFITEPKDLVFDPRYTGTDCGGDFKVYWYEPQSEYEKQWFIINFDISTASEKGLSSIVAYGDGADPKARTKDCSIWTYFYNTVDEDLEISFEPWTFSITGITLDKGLKMEATAKPYFEFQKERTNDPWRHVGPILGPFGPWHSTSYTLRDAVKPGPGYCAGYGLDKKNVKQNTLKIDIHFSIEEDENADIPDEAELRGRVGENSTSALLLHTGVNVKEGCSK